MFKWILPLVLLICTGQSQSAGVDSIDSSNLLINPPLPPLWSPPSMLVDTNCSCSMQCLYSSLERNRSLFGVYTGCSTERFHPSSRNRCEPSVGALTTPFSDTSPYQLLSDVVDALNERNVTYWLDFGSLMAAVRHGGRPMVRAGTEDVESLQQPQGQGCLDDVDLSILLEDAGPATEAFDAVQLKWSSASARVARFPSADASLEYQDYARLANRFLGNNWAKGEAIHVALKTKHDRRQVLDALDCPKEAEAKKERKTLVCRIINTITLGDVVVPAHSTLSLRKWRRLKTLPQSVWERRPVKPVRLIFTLVAQHQLNKKLSVQPHSLGGRLNYMLRLSFKNTEASPGKDADLVKVVQAWRQRCSTKTKTKTKTDRLHARSHYFQLDVMFWAWSADGQHLNRPGKTIPSTSIVNRHGQMPVANFMGKKIPVPHNPLSFLKSPERYGKDGLLCPSGTKAGMPSYLWHNKCGVHCPPSYQGGKHGPSGGVFVPPRPEHVGIADVFNFNVGRSSAALTVDERWRTWLLTSSTVDEATFAANVSPQLSSLQRATHLLARHLLHQFPSFALKGGYPRDVVIGNKHPNDLDFFLNTKKNPTAAHQVFEMADEIKQWSQNHGLFAEAPFCLQIARGCRGLHLIVCTASPTHKSGGKRSASCEHTNKVISIELTVISPWLPFFAANGLALQSDQGLTTVDPKRLAVMTAAGDSRSRTLRQVAHSSKEFLRRRSKFMRRGWSLGSPNDAEEFEDKEKLLAAESLKPDLRAMFPEMSAAALVDETVRPEFVARWRRLQSNNDFSRTNVCQLGEEPIWDGGETEDCMTCAPGKYQDHKNNKFWGPCKTCAPGLYTNGNHPGNHASVDNCLTCPEGKRFSNTPFRKCISCSVGQYQPQNGVASVICKTCPAGLYADQPMMTSCTACPAGRFNPTEGQATDHDALGDCNICSYGKYANGLGSTQCKECSAGFFLEDDSKFANEHVASSDCKACAAGWSAPPPVKAVCSSCPAGKYAPASTVSCTVCTSGQYSDKAANDAYGCLECPLGRIGAPGTDISSHDHADDCSVCPNGQYGVVASLPLHQCKNCPKGRFNPTDGYTDDHDSLDDCTICGDGEYGDQPGASSCKDCSTNTYTEGDGVDDHDGVEDCKTCPAGTTFSSTVPHCIGCIVGQYAELGFACQACPFGTYQDKLSESQCKDCVVGMYADVPSSSACKFCAAGLYVLFPRSACSPCDAGKFQPSNDVARVVSDCLSCMKGKYQSSTGSASCLECDSGTFQTSGVDSATSCKFCQAGRAFKDSLSDCTNCVKGRYQPSDSEAGVSCTLCADGYYADSTGESSCKPCSKGKYGSGDAASKESEEHCKACPSGYYLDQIGSTICKVCAAGFYNPAPNAVACIACPTAAEGAFVCAGCDAGKAGSTSTNSCTKCVNGKYAGGGFQECKDCPEGYWSASLSSSPIGPQTCTPCEIGKYSELSKAEVESACLSCAAGKFGEKAGADKQTFCSDCEPGFYQKEPGAGGQASCKQCEPGRWSPKKGMDQECELCKMGMFLPTYGSFEDCEVCPAGWYNCENTDTDCPVDRSRCEVCLPGQSQPNPQSTSCVDCLPGQISSQPKQIKCRDCDRGEYQAEKGRTFCLHCLRGQYQNSSQATKCNDCRTNEFIDDFGQYSCKKCQLGEYTDEMGSRQCRRCPAGKAGEDCISECETGKYRRFEDSPLSCLGCPQGWYQDEVGRDGCSKCSTGQYAQNENSTTCKLCDIGQYSNKKQTHNCITCTEGQYTQGKGNILCQECPIGFAGAGCQKCSAGMFRGASDGLVACRECDPGQYQNQEKQASCFPCVSGKYASERRSTNCSSCPTGWRQKSEEGRHCDICDDGKFAHKVGLSACQECAPGKFSKDSGAFSCALCPFGWKQKEVGGALCHVCATGQYSSETGMSACQKCPAGFAGTGSKCDHCTKGKFATSGISVCQDCDRGKFNNLNESASCLPCIPGKVNNKLGQIRCQKCSSGKFNDQLGQKSVSCKSCLPGFSQIGEGQTSCFACMPGKFALSESTSICKDCPLGWLQKEAKSTKCKIVPAGAIVQVGGGGSTEVAPGWQMTNCDARSHRCNSSEPCGAGTYGFIPANATCALCAAGQFSYEGALQCQPCETGKYAAKSGTQKCEECEVAERKYSDVESSTECKDCDIGRISIGKDCADVALNTNLDVPPMPIVLCTSQSNWTSLMVSWISSTQEEETRRTLASNLGYDLQVSTTSAFLLDDTRQLFLNENSAAVTVRNVQNFVSYFRVRVVGADSHDVGSWSAITKTWMSTSGKACVSPNAYLNATSLTPTEWSCAECPTGAWCVGSVTWDNVTAQRGYWRDRNNRTFFAKCANAVACLGGCVGDNPTDCPPVQDNHTDGCNEVAGYQRDCSDRSVARASGNPEDAGGSCRLCSTCRSGYSLGGDGVTCLPCLTETEEEKSNGIVAGIVIMLLVLLIFALLIFLKVKSSTSGGHGAKTKAVHSTIKRIVLTHMQLITLCFSLRVPWPNLIVMMMNVFSSMSSVSQHALSLSCYSENHNSVVGRQADFLYMLTGMVLMIPVFVSVVMYVWWLVFVPMSCCGWMSCGLRKKLVKSHVCCCRSSSDRQNPVVNSRTKSYRNSIVQNRAGAIRAHEEEQEQDTTVKTRDVWTYSVVLFVYMMFPSLVRFSMSLLSCRSIDTRLNAMRQGDTPSYLRTDMEELCWTGPHLLHVLLLALPGLLLYAIGIPLFTLLVLWRSRDYHHMNKYVFTFGLLYSGYRDDRWWWEIVVLLRKMLFIIVTAFLYEDSMQLHVMMAILIVAFTLHFMFLPFHVRQSVDDGPALPDSVGGESHITEDGMLLHRLERNSLLALLLLMWSANVFVLSKERCDSYFCIFLSGACLASNVVFMFQGIRLFIKFFLKRTKIAQHVSNLFSHISSKPVLDRVRLSFNYDRGGSTLEHGSDSSQPPVSIELSNHVLESQVEESRGKKSKKKGLKVKLNPLMKQQPTKDKASKEVSSTTNESKSTSKVIEYIVDPNTGNEYYIDPVTGVAKWRKKKPLPRQSRVGEMLEGMASIGIDYLVDPASGNEYYIDALTGDAKWKEGTKWD